MPKILQQIVDVLTTQVEPYNAYCHSLIGEKRIFGKMDLKLHNERTIAHFFDIEIQRKLEQPSKQYQIVSECSMKYLIAAKDKKAAESEIRVSADSNLKKYKKNSHELYIPDTVVIDFDKFQPHLYFIEYKVDSRFAICKLALDYLKYKYYSSGLGCHSSFIYVLFHKTPNNTIELRNCIDLNKILKYNVDYSDKSIFVFKMNYGNTQSAIPDNVIPLIDNAELTIKKLEANNLNRPKNDSQANSGLENNIFFCNKDRFKPNVIYAKTIQKNYPVISEMAKRIKSSTIDYNVKTDYSISPENFSTIEFSENDCVALSEHFTNQINKILGNEISSVSEILGFYRKRATWILVLLQKLAESNGWDDVSKKFKFNISDTAVNEYKKQLSEKYQNASSNLNKLSLGLLYFIVNLFSAIFNISSEGKIIDFNSQYTELTNARDINSIIRKIASELKLKTDENIDIENDRFQLELLQKIMDKYADIKH